MCAGTHNRVADLRRLKSDQGYVIDYLEKHCELFDQPATSLNKIGNIISYLAKEGIIIKPTEEALYDLFAMHKRCGFYMYVDPLDEEISI